MPIEIKELIVRGIVDGKSNPSDFDVIKTVKEQIEGYDFGLSEVEKKEISSSLLIEILRTSIDKNKQINLAKVERLLRENQVSRSIEEILETGLMHGFILQPSNDQYLFLE